MTNFCLIYIEIGIQRVSLAEQLVFLPRLLHGIAGKPESQVKTLFQIILPILTACHSIDSIEKDVFDFQNHQQDCQVIVTLILYLVLYVPSKEGAVPSGLSKKQLDLITLVEKKKNY